MEYSEILKFHSYSAQSTELHLSRRGFKSHLREEFVTRGILILLTKMLTYKRVLCGPPNVHSKKNIYSEKYKTFSEFLNFPWIQEMLL